MPTFLNQINASVEQRGHGLGRKEMKELKQNHTQLERIKEEGDNQADSKDHLMPV